jgi:methyltransferase-like protein
LCRELLTPDGVAFVSYNALPGGYPRQMAREMMLQRVAAIEDAGEKLRTGIGFLRAVLQARAPDDPFRRLLEEQIASMEKRSPEAVFHDEFSEVNDPSLFRDFVARADRHGMQYLSEAALPAPPDPAYRADLRPAVEDVGRDDIIAQEQALDFMRMRKYRETLLCHKECNVRRDFSRDVFRRLLLASQVESSSGENGSRVFTLPGGIKMETTHPGTIALMEQLAGAWPRTLSWEEIGPGIAKEFSLGDNGPGLLMRLALSKMIELHAWKAPVATEISRHPKASTSALHEARIRSRVTTLQHMTVHLEDPVVRSFLLLLDGTRDRAALLDALKAEYPDLPPDRLEQGIEPNLRMFHRAAVLES